MTEPGARTERTARIVIAVLGVIAASLGTLTAYFAATKSDVVQQRNDVRSDVSTLTTQQSTLKDQVTSLRRENADLRQQLDAASTDPSPPADASGNVVTRTLRVPLPDDGSSSGVSLDDGVVNPVCCANFAYGRQQDTNRPQIQPGSTPFSTAVNSAQVSREDCSQATAGSPTIKPIPPPRSGLICASSRNGVSLLRIAAPQKDGTLKISQKYWPNP
jgi:cell division protein FtsB